MRGAIIDPSGLKQIVLADLTDREPGPDEVVLNMRCASLNYRDLFIRENPSGPYGGDMRGKVPLSDGVGIVVAKGANVSSVTIGDRVCPVFFPKWFDGGPTPDRIGVALGAVSGGGVALERLVVRSDAVVKVPSHLTDAEAASLVCAGLTAWASLVEYGRVTSGQTVLVQGTGGVSVFALQFAHAVGARTILLSSSDEKLERGRALGADETLNYRANPNWAEAVLEVTGGRGVDHIVDIGGQDTLPKSFDAIGLGGNIAIVGVLTGFAGAIPYDVVKRKLLHVYSVFVGSKAQFERMNAFISAHQIHPVVDRIFDFSEIDAAVASLAAGSHFGKLVIDLARK